MASKGYPQLSLWVAGKCVTSLRNEMNVYNPSSEEVLGKVPIAAKEDVDASIDAADRNFTDWRSTSSAERSRLLRKVADILRERKSYIASVITLELGKPFSEALDEVETAAGMFEWNAEEARRGYGRVVPSRDDSIRQIVLREPVGPIAAFSSWNAPAVTPSRKISGALAAGCTIVLKASEETPGTVLEIARAVRDAGCPDGVLSVLFGDPQMISDKLLTSHIIKGVTFTGSVAIGKSVGMRAIEGMKRVTLELGGHAPVLIFEDVDVEAVARAAVISKFRNAGQICTAPTRFFVHESIHDRFAEAFADFTNSLHVGDGFDPCTQMGPLANTRRIAAIEELINDARRNGVKIAAGGNRISGRGYFWQPTLLVNAGLKCAAANIEPFGPLAMTMPFSSLPEAVRLANRLPFGLAAYAMTRDLERAHRIAQSVESGNIAINHWRVSLPETPFGGQKESGLGSEGGVEGLQAFQNIKYLSETYYPKFQPQTQM